MPKDELIIEIGTEGDFTIESPGKIEGARHVMVENLVESMIEVLGEEVSRKRKPKYDQKVIEVGRVESR